MLVYLHIHTHIYSWKRESIFTRKNASPTPIAINKYTNICWNISTQTHITACIGIRPQYYLSPKQRFEWKRTYLHSDIIRQNRYTAVWCPPVQRSVFFYRREKQRNWILLKYSNSLQRGLRWSPWTWRAWWKISDLCR